MRLVRIFRLSLLFLIFLLLITIAYFVFAFYQFANTPLLAQAKYLSQPIKSDFKSREMTIIVSPGMNVPELMVTLQNHHLLTHPTYFNFLALYKHARFHLKVGEYLITETLTPNQLLNHILQGRVYMRKIVFIEGGTFNQMKQSLLNNPYLKHTVQNYSDQKIMQMIGAKPNTAPEGMFFPDTYEYTLGNTDLLILKTSYQYMQHFLTRNWPTRSADLPYENPYQALIVASMVERETSLNKERPIIAGIILNRWQKGMRLQIDPTVLYGVGKSYKEVIMHKDLWDQNLFNTYRHKGLPPTPISMPGAASILAALHPQKTAYLYFVAKGKGIGHQFSETYAGQRAAVTHYRIILNSAIASKEFKNENFLTSFYFTYLPSRIFCINFPPLKIFSKTTLRNIP